MLLCQRSNKLLNNKIQIPMQMFISLSQEKIIAKKVHSCNNFFTINNDEWNNYLFTSS
jgi:hypothetical protein